MSAPAVPPAAHRLVGTSVKRREDGRLVAGRARYLDDIAVPGMLHLAVVRSPHAHARVRGVARDAALALEGVSAVLTLADLPECAGSVPPLVPAAGMHAYVHPVLAGDRVRHVGEAVAVVIADSAYRAADGVERVRVDYEPLAAATTVQTALAPGAPRVHADWPDNLAGVCGGATGDAARALTEADVVVEGDFAYPRMAGMPIETRGVLAWPDPATGGLEVWCSTQVPFAVRAAIAMILSVPEERVRVRTPDVGGGFGVKGHVYPEDVLVPAVAQRLGRPVKWVETRHEHALTAAGDRDQAHHARLGVRRDGTVVALQTRFTRDHGAYPTLGEAIALNTINHLPGPYRVPHYRGEAENVVTHKTFIAAYRGAGRPEAAFVVDRLLDRAARRLDIDPAALRRTNLVRADEMPYRTGLAYRDGAAIAYDPADYVAGFDRLLELAEYERWRKETTARRGSRHPVGVGLSAYVEGTGLGPFEGADVRVDPSGTVYVYVGVSAQGQAHETTLAQICADHLGVPIADVVVVGGDTSLVGFGMGTIASRVAAVAGPAVARSAAEVARRARVVAAEQFECAADDVVIADGRASVRGVPERALRLGDLARAAVRSRALMPTGSPGLSACAFFYPGSVTWAFGAHAAVVEVDVETCAVRVLRYAAVHDCGRPINPMVVEGQVHGGIAQGIGSALGEALVHDEAGQLLTGSLMDYFLPRADDLPRLDVAHLDFASAVNELGIKGVGESGVIAPAAAIANAVEDALADRGVRIDRVPITSAYLFEALSAGRR
ncbi:MAG TPA: xanthine dehydrogenase family protein molybdopterin-binding subunit [Methylomirabilota bacterium]|nr:xanthine dehydrogenase family protein molybdopterin-binding subunit [Methylomirabilota bacterium]